MTLTFKQLQEEHKIWSSQNFDVQYPSEGIDRVMPILGCVEEMGELAHAILKQHHNIRGSSEKHTIAAKDAIGDLMVFVASTCSSLGFDLQEIVEETWAEVSKRDYKKDAALKGSDVVVYNPSTPQTYGTFTVNGEHYVAFTPELTYEHICKLGNCNPQHAPTVIAHWKGSAEDESGHKMVLRGQSIKVRPGMRIGVCYTGNA